MTISSVRLFGIPNCDTVKKSRQWFADQGLTVAFHDFKKQGLDAATLAQWSQAVGVALLLNRKGTTWRQLSPEEQLAATNSDAGAQALMLSHTSVIKRPVVVFETGSSITVTVGYVPDQWQSLLAQA